MVNFGKSDKRIKIRGKVDKSNTYNGFSNDISFLFTEELLQTVSKCLIYPLFHLFL